MDSAAYEAYVGGYIREVQRGVAGGAVGAAPRLTVAEMDFKAKAAAVTPAEPRGTTGGTAEPSAAEEESVLGSFVVVKPPADA